MRKQKEITLSVSAGRVTYSAPNVCISCGRSSVQNVETVLRLCPWWLYVITGFLIAEIFIEKKTRMSIPICKRHRSLPQHLLLVRALPAIIGIVAVMIGALGLFFVAKDALIVVPVAVAFLALAWGVEWLVRRFSLHATSITDSELRLTGVSEQFAHAVENNEPTVAYQNPSPPSPGS